MTLHHGSDHIIYTPLYGVGKEDNDYGSGFYTTEDSDKAKEWALIYGNQQAVVNTYTIDTNDLNILYLDHYGTLAWIAEIIHHRGARGEVAQAMGDEIVKNYKIDTTNADIIIGYRADDSYIDIVDAFLNNQVSLDEVEYLFKKGQLGYQVFIKSELAFQNLQFQEYSYIQDPNFNNSSEVHARIEVSQFLKNRATAIALHNFHPNGIIARDVIHNEYQYNIEYQYYELIDKNKGEYKQ